MPTEPVRVGSDVGVVILLPYDMHLDRSVNARLLKRLLHGLVECLVPIHSIWTYQLCILNSVCSVKIIFELLLIGQLERPEFAFSILLSNTCVVIAES